MEQNIRARYSNVILDQAITAFGIHPGHIQELNGFESYIYEFTCGVEQGILRISHSIRRSPDQIRGELDWIQYLKSGGAGVAGAILSQNGHWVEEIDDSAGGVFLAAAFEKAPGEIHKGEWSEGFLFEYGRQIGLMHKLTRSYQPTNPDWKRPDWDDPLHLDVIQFIPPRDQQIKQIYWDLIERTRSLPADRSGFGLIHQDAHRGNLFVDANGKITIFDFDDSSYSWFVEDIALVLFYAVMGQADPAGFTAHFLSGFLPGYYSQSKLDQRWFQEIPLFMKRRELDLYAVIHRSFDVENLNDPWCSWFLDGRKERLEKGLPFLDYDFSDFSLAEFL